MRNSKRIVYATIISCMALFSACGKGDDEPSTKAQDTSKYVVESTKDTEKDETPPRKTTSNENSDSNEETTKGNEGGLDVNEAKKIDGFYNCYDSEQSFLRIDFEVKTTEDGYIALFYSQYSYINIYESGQILYGEKTGDNTF